jgi:hypothetical protein
MKHDIIKTDNYLLVGSNDDLKRGWFYCVRTKSIFKDEGEDVLCCIGDIRIVAHLPLNNSPILEGVDLLPPLEVVKYDFAQMFYDILKSTYPNFDEWVEAKEYNKAKEKYKWTDEDLRKVLTDKSLYELSVDEIIQSLQQPKYPIRFECEMVTRVLDVYPQTINHIPKTTTNSQSQTVLEGKYIYEN